MSLQKCSIWLDISSQFPASGNEGRRWDTGWHIMGLQEVLENNAWISQILHNIHWSFNPVSHKRLEVSVWPWLPYPENWLFYQAQAVTVSQLHVEFTLGVEGAGRESGNNAIPSLVFHPTLAFSCPHLAVPSAMAPLQAQNWGCDGWEPSRKSRWWIFLPGGQTLWREKSWGPERMCSLR